MSLISARKFRKSTPLFTSCFLRCVKPAGDFKSRETPFGVFKLQMVESPNGRRRARKILPSPGEDDSTTSLSVEQACQKFVSIGGSDRV